MRKAVSLVLFLFIAAGCASSISSKQKKPTLVLLNGSPSEKTNLSDLLTHYLIHYINLKAGLNVERVHKDQTTPLELIASQDKKEESVFLRVNKFRIFSDDALFKPLAADLTLELEVLDKNGAQIYRTMVTGHHENPAVIPVLEETARSLAEGVVKDTLKRLIQDPELKKIIAKYKYGTLGSIASIF